MKRIHIIAVMAALTFTGTVAADYKSSVKQVLRDPASAQFKDVGIYRGGGTPVYCGYVNSKNGFGGMSGWKNFISNGGSLTFIMGQKDLPDAEFKKVWNRFCK